VPDLLVAATAEEAGLIVLHYDADFDRVAAMTGEKCEWVATQGSIDWVTCLGRDRWIGRVARPPWCSTAVRAVISPAA
jgi:hypothetical protein